MKVLSFLTATAISISGAALADGPVVLDAAQLDTVTAAGSVTFLTDVTKVVAIDKSVNLNVNKQVTSVVDLTGTLATAEASADAIEFENNLAEVDTFAQVQPGGAFAFAESLAAGN